MVSLMVRYYRQYILHHLPNLTKIGAEDVTEEERRDAQMVRCPPLWTHLVHQNCGKSKHDVRAQATRRVEALLQEGEAQSDKQVCVISLVGGGSSGLDVFLGPQASYSMRIASQGCWTVDKRDKEIEMAKAKGERQREKGRGRREAGRGREREKEGERDFAWVVKTVARLSIALKAVVPGPFTRTPPRLRDLILS
ncbi:hypothetical protein AK812_SmicGene43759 [Symbiodinium microadriaticum]|uniref:Uncharacterized protein n=1 Tax=Symbiodinium microadriaticum TaxID=2951 RepID=A0A1Q9C080_SYMMI|nr:hypothetical protein AK812_SmicGene43759 [Symbiodinium microadriaticum]